MKSDAVDRREEGRNAFLTLLQRFSNEYLPEVNVSWGKFDDYGRSDFDKKKIYLRPDMPLDLDDLDVGGDYHVSYEYAYEKLNLVEGEQYFLALLHEIGYFYSRERPPPDDFLPFFREAISMEELPQEMLERHFGRGSKSELEERIWHSVIHGWAIYQFRERREEIRTYLREENLREVEDS